MENERMEFFVRGIVDEEMGVNTCTIGEIPKTLSNEECEEFVRDCKENLVGRYSRCYGDIFTNIEEAVEFACENADKGVTDFVFDFSNEYLSYLAKMKKGTIYREFCYYVVDYYNSIDLDYCTVGKVDMSIPDNEYEDLVAQDGNNFVGHGGLEAYNFDLFKSFDEALSHATNKYKAESVTYSNLDEEELAKAKAVVDRLMVDEEYLAKFSRKN